MSDKTGDYPQVKRELKAGEGVSLNEGSLPA